jgi:hypothetical protein
MEISAKLKSLGLKLGKSVETHKSEFDAFPYPIDRIVDGEYKETSHGLAFYTKAVYPLGFSHGLQTLDLVRGLTMLASWAKTSKLTTENIERIIFLDTETTGLAGGSGTYAFLIGLGYFTPAEFVVEQYFMTSPVYEAAILTQFLERLTGFDIIVTFNGKSFDVPLLNTRLTINSLSSPLDLVDHVDLLHLARRLWRDRLPQRSMSFLEEQILGCRRDLADVPGYLIPQYYFDYLSNGDARPLAGVFYHNRIDIVSIAALFQHTAEILEHPLSHDLPALDTVAVARLYEEQGRLEEAAGLYATGLMSGLPGEVYRRTVERFASMRRKQGRYDLCLALWEKLAQDRYLVAFEEIAKLFEHRFHNSDQALHWTQKGLEMLNAQRLTKYEKQIWEDKFQKRRQRLLKKHV